MSIAKFDLYNAEWLDLVFDHRNKEYGAYDLRKNYGRTMGKAIGFALTGVAILVVASIIFKPKIDHTRIIADIPIIDMKTIKTEKIIEKPKQAEPAKPAAPVKPAAPIQTTAFTTPHIVPTDPPVDPPVIKNITGAIGPETVKGPVGGDNATAKTETGSGGNGTAAANPGIIDANEGTLEVMPEPIGGAAAWGKFLQKNLRFPAVAQEQGVSGRVIMSFIIEKDGSLSNIKVERGAGYGFDEEALRVLKLAKAWKPGIQNGQPVRVRYNIPINFQLSE
ncbi:energy transducer TonB [Mucilaginibacter sp. NFX135]|uniref:energy transducer TonB n=1 Tax=Mucilaginibacter sp. NFX135 TaxID=3402687 RepID=UPI003AFADBF7